MCVHAISGRRGHSVSHEILSHLSDIEVLETCVSKFVGLFFLGLLLRLLKVRQLQRLMLLFFVVCTPLILEHSVFLFTSLFH